MSWTHGYSLNSLLLTLQKYIHQYCIQQELGSSITVHTAFGFLILSLLTLLQVKYQNSGNPYQTHSATMLLFVLAVLVYTIALAGMSQLTSNTSYLPLLRCVCFIFGAFSCDLLLLILVPPFGWFILILCVCVSFPIIMSISFQSIQKFFHANCQLNRETSGEHARN
ncbi:hypothetical protein ACB092_09G185600 [Castanea dentata]